MSRVTLTNPFDLLTDENEDRTNVPTPKKEQKPAAPAKPAAKPAATGVAAKPPQKTEGAKAPAKPADAKAAPKQVNNNTVKPAPQRDSNQNLQEINKESRAPRDKRDRPPHPAGDKREKRPNDRKSGTGRPQNEVKRGGQGKNNWGGEVDAKEAEALNKEEKTAEKEEVADAQEEKVEAEGEKKEGEAKEEVAPAPVEEETFTYEEYLARKSKKANVPSVEAFKPRQVTADDFGGLTPLARADEGLAPFNKKKEAAKPKEEKPKAATEEKSGDKKEKKEKVNLAATLLKFESHQDVKYKERREYNRSYSDDGRRGGDNRRGGGGGKGGNRGPRPDSQSNANASKAPAQSEFPTLGGHGADPVKA